jgi:hypothetical protein
MEIAKQESSKELWEELLDIINKQLDTNIKLKEILEKAVASSSGNRGLNPTEEIANEIKDLLVETESLQGKVRAVFHQLFGADTEGELRID